MIVTQENIDAINEANKFKDNSIYNNIMCCKPKKGGAMIVTISKSLINLEEIGITESEKSFFLRLHEDNKNYFCCLPNGHSGSCKTTYKSFFSEKAELKIKDCQTSPGDDEIIFKNRTTRSYPIQISNSIEKELKERHSLKSRGLKLKAAVPIKHASTPFLMATAEFDIASFILQLEEPKDMDQYIKDKLNDNFNRLVNFYKSNGIYITNKYGNLCCPVTGKSITIEMLGEKGDNQIQFGHVDPVSNDKYMTRGENLVLITRLGNSIQGDRELSKVKFVIEDCYTHLNRL
jgi:hypothetical protein